jgi:K+-transporting ATPase A subunit
MGLMPLTSFTAIQRCAGAFAIGLLAMPILFILFHLRALFLLYAEGIVFAPANARRLRFAGLGLALYALAPFVANRTILLAGVTADPAWLHIDEALALLLGALLFVAAQVAAFGREIEQERDGFV